jgi:hypothetical protein
LFVVVVPVQSVFHSPSSQVFVAVAANSSHEAESNRMETGKTTRPRGHQRILHYSLNDKGA